VPAPNIYLPTRWDDGDVILDKAGRRQLPWKRRHCRPRCSSYKFDISYNSDINIILT